MISRNTAFVLQLHTPILLKLLPPPRLWFLLLTFSGRNKTPPPHRRPQQFPWRIQPIHRPRRTPRPRTSLQNRCQCPRTRTSKIPPPRPTHLTPKNTRLLIRTLSPFLPSSPSIISFSSHRTLSFSDVLRKRNTLLQVRCRRGMRRSRFVPGLVFPLLRGRSVDIIAARCRSWGIYWVFLAPFGDHGEDILVRKWEFIVVILGAVDAFVTLVSYNRSFPALASISVDESKTLHVFVQTNFWNVDLIEELSIRKRTIFANCCVTSISDEYSSRHTCLRVTAF